MQEIEALAVRPAAIPKVDILDVTLRDGGFRTNFNWSEPEIGCVIESVSNAGVAIVELGYIGGVPELHSVETPGLGANISPEIVARMGGRFPGAQLAAMIHPKAVSVKIDFEQYRRSGLRMIRFVYHPSWLPELQSLAARAKAADFLISINVALISRYELTGIIEILKPIVDLAPDVVFLADTCSALLPSEVRDLFSVTRGLQVPLGFHSHDFLSLAYANSFVAAESGAKYIDASLMGIGRGAGNLKLELWLAIGSARAGHPGKLEALVPALEIVGRKLAGCRSGDLSSIVAGALNLSPPQEDYLRSNIGEWAGSLERGAALLADNFRGSRTLPDFLTRADHAVD